MGVTGLWQIVQPCARPIKIETLNRKRLAVDASIWIYQFLKAVRDKEGNALRNSHVVGFFRRICKLLFFGIKPVFVFDGGAPALKRQTIRARQSRREGRREDAVRTAGKLLAVQMQRRAEEEEAQRNAQKARRPDEAEQEEAVPDGDLVYVDELHMTQQERQQNRKFRKKDQYHLPDLNVSLSEMGGPNDPRVMSLEELQVYARQFDTGEDINVYDFSKIDYDSPFFTSLPPSDRYNILNAARLRSRLRMGHSKEQLDSMFPDRMAFSKFQIERVRERNELTQRLMYLNGSETMEFGGRVAGEKGREYVLVKNEGVEGGWALGVISDEGRMDKPIDIDQPAPLKKEHAEGEGEWEDDEDFEDIPIEGLNRLPKQRTRNEQVSDNLLEQRRAVYSSRRATGTRKRKPKAAHDPNSLFVQSSEDEGDEEWEHIDGDNQELSGQDEEDDELRRAIAMSLEEDGAGPSESVAPEESGAENDKMLETFQQTAVQEQRPVPRGSGRNIANIVNKRAFNAAPDSREITSFGVPTLRPDDSDEDDVMDFQAALAESRKHKRKPSPPRRRSPPLKRNGSTSDIAKKAGFQGPLPFEKLDLGTSLLGKKKMQERTAETAGGFENPELAQKGAKKAAEPLPPWFSGDLEADMQAQNVIEAEDRQKARDFHQQFRFQQKGEMLRRADTGEVIDLDADDASQGYTNGEVVDLEAEEPSAADLGVGLPADDVARMGDLADDIRADPTIAMPPGEQVSPNNRIAQSASRETDSAPSPADAPPKRAPQHIFQEEEEEEELWSESDREDVLATRAAAEPLPAIPVSSEVPTPVDDAIVSPSSGIVDHVSKVPSPELEDVEFEDVDMLRDPPPETVTPAVEQGTVPNIDEEDESQPGLAPGLAVHESIPEDAEFDDFSDPEDAEMLRALTLEAEEHARFASSLNNKSQAQNIQEYDRELKQLRNQQKKERRDADEVTQIMIQECQALLRLFGLPYITAPMEAEAQCAELVRLGLVDGIVTDDSDCFLFGGTRIYKNMFNQAKFVECYLTSDLEKEFALTRDKLISVAHLLGSDYTEGLPGIGPVTAIEIVSEFQTLEAFKDWWTAVQMNQIPKTKDATNPFRKKFRRNAAKLFLPPAFPDQRVGLAYQNPDVDSDPQAFQWGVPNLDALRSFLMSTIGWSQERTDEVLVPVIRDMNRRVDEGTQANITHFFDGTVGVGAAATGNASGGRREGFAPRKRVEGSKRMGSALSKMAERAKLSREGTSAEEPVAGDARAPADGEDVAGRQPATKKVPRKRKPNGQHVNASEVGSDEAEDDESEGPQTKKPKRRARAAKVSGKRKVIDDEEHDD